MTRDGKEIWRSKISGSALAAMLSVDKASILCGTFDREEGVSRLLSVDAKTGGLLRKYPNELKGEIRGMWFESGRNSEEADTTINVVLSDGSVTVLEERGNALIERAILQGEPNLKAHLRLPTTNFLVTSNTNSSGTDGTIHLYDITSTDTNGNDVQLVPLRKLQGHTSAVLCFAFLPTRSLLFSGSYDRTIRVWDVSTWKCIKTLKGHGSGIKCLTVSADGTMLFSAGADNTIRVWSTTAWVCLRLLHGRHADTTWPSVVALWDHCGAREESRTPIFVSGSTGTFGGSSIKVFNSKTGNCLDTLLHLEPEQRGHITALMFSTDGAVLYSAASDGSIVAWPTSAILSQQHKPIAALKSGFLN